MTKHTMHFILTKSHKVVFSIENKTNYFQSLFTLNITMFIVYLSVLFSYLKTAVLVAISLKKDFKKKIKFCNFLAN